MYSLAPPSREHLERLQTLSPGLEVVVAANEAHALDAAADAEVILGHRYLRQCLPLARCLKWVQSSAGGIDRLPLADLAERGVILSRSTLDSDTVAAHALALAWSVSRGLPQAYRQQQVGTWDQRLALTRLPETAIVIGLGAVGTAIAKRLKAQGITVLCGKRSKPAADPASPCAEIFCNGAWRSALPRVDWCFLALVHTPETTKIFDETALRALPPHAVLVNVGRGETLDTDALQRVLLEGHLAGVALDVFESGPLPTGHPLWHAPRTLITPHVASHHPGRIERIERYFEEQLSRYLSGQPLKDLVELPPTGSGDPAVEANT